MKIETDKIYIFYKLINDYPTVQKMTAKTKKNIPLS